MTTRFSLRRPAGVLLLAVGLLTVGGASASATPIFLPTLQREIKHQRAIWHEHLLAPAGPLTPPAPPCPENGLLPSPFSNCGLPELPATTLPFPGNMAYWGGHVQVSPKVYLVYWGWGEPGAWSKGTRCKPVSLVTGSKLKCDPDGAGAYMARFVHQMGGTQWARVQTQYYQQRSSGKRRYITNPKNQLGGIWVDDTNNIRGLPKTSATNPPGPKNTYTDLAAEAQRAVAHFHITNLSNANIVIAQPPKYSDPNALASGYCAFHDYTEPGLEAGIYNHLKPGISYTNMPYSLAINSTPLLGGGSVNDCGENAVNSGPAGKVDGFSIALGHEIEETVTDPGAEDILGGSGLNKQKYLGGWYDAVDANENGDKCAWVGEPLIGGVPGAPNVLPVPGAMGDIKGNAGGTFAVQSLWSNKSAKGLGYCAGSGTNLPTG